MKTLDDLDVDGRRVLVRVDFNVPLEDGEVADDTRIRAALPTLRSCASAARALILVVAPRAPEGPRAGALAAAGRRAARGAARREVKLAPGVVGDGVTQMAHALDPGEVLLLENLRFQPGETKNDPTLAAGLAALADVYVNDAFGTAHRAHASTEGVAHRVSQSGAGRLLEREVKTLERDPRRLRRSRSSRSSAARR